ncbi:MAG: hypothetical protein AAGJ18_15075 [Bacteroidota bacterium]
MKSLCWLSLSLSLLLPIQLLAQNELPKEIEETVKLDGQDFTKIIEFFVPDKADDLYIVVQGRNSGGRTRIYVYDPNGKKECYLGLKADSGTSKGHMHENTDHPVAGVWSIKVINAGATGKLNISVKQW